MSAADRINEAFDQAKPWTLAKDRRAAGELQSICSRALFGFKHLAVILAPILPELASRVARQLFGLDRDFDWADAIEAADADRSVRTPHDPHRPQADRCAGRRSADKPWRRRQRQPATRPRPAEPPPPISIDEFSKVELRIAKIVNAEHVDGADKLLKLTLDIGEARHRTVFAGIKSAYKPEDLIGRLTPMVANLAPRKMKFGLSEGMVLAASGEGPGIFLLTPDSGAAAGHARKVTRMSKSKTRSVAAIGNSRVIPAKAGIQCVRSFPRSGDQSSRHPRESGDPVRRAIPESGDPCRSASSPRKRGSVVTNWAPASAGATTGI